MEPTIYLRVKENRKYIPIISPDLTLRVTLISPNYPVSNIISWFQLQVFEPLRLYCSISSIEMLYPRLVIPIQKQR